MSKRVTESTERVRVIIADDHTILLEALRKIVEPEYDVVGLATDGRALVESALSLRPDIIIVDIAMPLMNGLEAGWLIKQKLPSTKLIFLTMNEDPDLALEALRSGASGYVLKSSAASALVLAMRAAVKGKTFVSPQIAGSMQSASIGDSKHSRERYLTARQREVVHLLAEGKSMKEVATILNVSLRTAAFHKYRIMELLRLKTTQDLVAYAIKSRLAET
jgi:DNA-binding NarL/FixJ family response regulator